MSTTKLQQAFLDYINAPNTVGSMAKITDAIKANDHLMKWCLEVLDQEALAADDWKRPADKCSSWFRIRAELRDQLSIVTGNDAPAGAVPSETKP